RTRNEAGGSGRVPPDRVSAGANHVAKNETNDAKSGRETNDAKSGRETSDARSGRETNDAKSGRETSDARSARPKQAATPNPSGARGLGSVSSTPRWRSYAPKVAERCTFVI